MIIRERFRIGILSILLIAAYIDGYSESFSDFFIRFFYNPQLQNTMVKYPIMHGSTMVSVKSGWQPIYLRNKNRILVLCCDSLNSSGKNGHTDVSIVSTQKLSGTKYSFTETNTKWYLTKSTSVSSTQFSDSGFIDFLTTFSSEAEFQKKHIIFPIKEICYNRTARTESNNKLYMPREWQHINFVNIYPTLCRFGGDESDDIANRRLVVYEQGLISEVYNFIRIRGNWFLIEIEKYE